MGLKQRQMPKLSPSNNRNHQFIFYNKPAWCDHCEDFMWGLRRHNAFKCSVCKYMCHEKCMADCTFDCPGVSKRNNANAEDSSKHNSRRASSSANSPSRVKSSVDVGTTHLHPNNVSFQPQTHPKLKTFIVHPMQNTLLETLVNIPKDVLKKQFELSFTQFPVLSLNIDEANSKQNSQNNQNWHPKLDFITNNNVHMELVLEFNKLINGIAFKMEADAVTFTGTMNIYLRFKRPVNAGGACSLTLKNALKRKTNSISRNKVLKNDMRKSENVQSFKIPEDTVATVNINSSTTVKEVIENILEKYNIVCDSRKYGLFLEIMNEANNKQDSSSSDVSQVLGSQYPLVEILKWGPNDTSHIFFLRENDNEDDMWALFAIPELNNFIQILDIEEAEILNKINLKFDKYKQVLEQLAS